MLVTLLLPIYSMVQHHRGVLVLLLTTTVGVTKVHLKLTSTKIERNVQNKSNVTKVGNSMTR